MFLITTRITKIVFPYPFSPKKKKAPSWLGDEKQDKYIIWSGLKEAIFLHLVFFKVFEQFRIAQYHNRMIATKLPLHEQSDLSNFR